ncbi:MAG: hypothetical protein GWP06_00360 [Actinobacteria bacterium]|nr:hypothetical protein [Actinomycetota bacterium]
MAFITQTTQQVFDSAINFIESKINQTTPGADKAYNKVLAGLLSMLYTILLKFATDRAKEVLTISASIIGLRVIGQGRNIEEKVATSAVHTFEVPALFGTIIETSVIYTGDANGVRYQPNAQVTAAVTNIATITATALTPGVVGNLAVGQTLQADRQVSGAETQGTITVIVTTAANAEEVEAYRQRLLDDERTEGGGSDSADYRKNAEKTPGVNRAFPYTGNSTYLETGLGTINPVAITIYIKADESIDPDGVPTAQLLLDADEYIKTDQDTQLANQVLTGDIDSLREVLPIFNTTFFVVVSGFDVSGDVKALVKSDIETALKAYFRSVQPFILGLDFILDKNDEVTVPSVSSVVEDVVKAAGGKFTAATFNVGAGSLLSFTLEVGELAKLADTGGVSYV